MAVLVTAIHESSREPVVKIIPTRIDAAYHPDLPRPRPVLHRPLALNGGADVLVMLCVDQALEALALGEPAESACAVHALLMESRPLHSAIGLWVLIIRCVTANQKYAIE